MMIGQSTIRPQFYPSQQRLPLMTVRPPMMPRAAQPARPPIVRRPGFFPTAPAASGWNAQLIAQRNLIQQREFNRLLRENVRLSREQAAIMAQQAAAQQVPMVPPPAAAPPMPTAPVSPQVSSQPTSAGGDLTPTQDAADDAAASAQPEAPPRAHGKHLFLFLGLAAAAGVGGYVLIKRKKAKP